MMKKAVIFDFDYTLGDSTKGIVQSVNYGMKQMGLMERGRGEIVKTIGLSLAKTYEKLTGRADKSEIERFEHYFVERQMRSWSQIRFFMMVLRICWKECKGIK